MSSKNLSEKIILYSCLVLLSLLLFKDIFSTRTLVPNLEPYPDSIHYINPSFSFLRGYGLFIEREGRLIAPSVPPMYSLALMPMFLIKQDARFFYFTNAILSFLSFFFLYRILKITAGNIYVVGLLLFLYVTNYFVYWYPTIPMAENLSQTIFLGLLFLTLKSINRLNIFLYGFFTVGLYYTKFSNIPLTLTFILIFFLKIFLETKQKKEKIENSLFFLCILILSAAPFYFYDLIVRDRNNLSVIFNNLNIAFSGKSGQVATAEKRTAYFSLNYFQSNLNAYINSILGKPMRFLWDSTPIVPVWVGLSGIIGLAAGFFEKNLKLIALAIILSIFSSIIFLSTFYTVDARYIYHAIPSLLIGCSFLLRILIQKYKLNGKYILGGVFIIFMFYSFASFQRLKYQISLNLRHGETPWYYVSVLNLNEYFKNNYFEKKPVVISVLPPYYIDFFSNGKYSLLPMSKDQEFYRVMVEVWGPNDYSDLNNLFGKYINEGNNVFITNYGLGNEQYLHNAFDEIAKKFSLTKVKDGCDGACNIYRVNLNKK